MAEGNVYNLNLTMEEMEDLCIRQLRAGMSVWFGCDSDCYGNRKNGVWDPDSLDYEGVMGGADLFMEKGARLQSHASYATHAMILTGVNFDENGEPNRWKIENSWGGDVGLVPVCEPFRGGTDGAALSFRGLPCPNLSAGYENAHGRFEFVPIQSMEKNVEILLRLCSIFAGTAV